MTAHCDIVEETVKFLKTSMEQLTSLMHMELIFNAVLELSLWITQKMETLVLYIKKHYIFKLYEQP